MNLKEVKDDAWLSLEVNRLNMENTSLRDLVKELVPTLHYVKARGHWWEDEVDKAISKAKKVLP